MRVRQLGEDISREYKDKGTILVIGLLNGAFMFVSDLLKHLQVPYEVDFMVCSSYGVSTESSGSVKLKKDVSINPANRHILIVEDLIDTGTTLTWLMSHLTSKGPASIRLAVFLDKISQRKTVTKCDFIGYICPDEFVVGYGMDFAHSYRCLPFIASLKPSAYSAPPSALPL